MRRRWMASHENLRRALFFVETVIILDNSSAIEPLQPLAYIDKGEFTFRAASMSAHIASLLPSAQELIDAFLRDVARACISAEPLRATLYTGQSVKTDKRGWYLRKNQSVAVGEDGGYYILTVPGGLKERLRGVRLRRSPPPLIVGKGGRDGETGDLVEFLARRLQQG